MMPESWREEDRAFAKLFAWLALAVVVFFAVVWVGGSYGYPMPSAPKAVEP